MKTLIILLLIVLPINLYSQINMGTIYVNNDYTATLNFPDEVLFVVFGNNPQIAPPAGTNNEMPEYKFFGCFVSGSTVILRLNDKNAKLTSITIKLKNNAVYYGSINQGPDAKIYYDFNEQIVKKIEQKQLLDSLKKEKEQSTLDERITKISQEKQEYYDLADIVGKIEFQITSIRNDNKYTYLKLFVRNNSGSDYEIDNINFKYVEGKSTGLGKKQAKIEERINPVYEDSKKILKSYSEVSLVYVIPLFSISKGTFVIQVIEKKGTRNPRIEIESDIMLKVKIYE